MRKLFSIIPIILLALSLAWPAWGADLYVNSDNNTGDGSSNSPWALAEIVWAETGLLYNTEVVTTVRSTVAFTRTGAKIDIEDNASRAENTAIFDTVYLPKHYKASDVVASWVEDYVVQEVDVNLKPLANKGSTDADSLYRWDGSEWAGPLNTQDFSAWISSVKKIGSNIYIGTGGGTLYRSTDNLATAATQIASIGASYTIQKWGLAEGVDGRVWLVGYKIYESAVTDMKVYRSDANGANFTAVYTFQAGDATWGTNYHLHKIFCHPTDADVAYVSQGDADANTTANIWKIDAGAGTATAVFSSMVQGFADPRAQPTNAILKDSDTILWIPDNTSQSAVLKHTISTDAFEVLNSFDPVANTGGQTFYDALLYSGVLYLPTQEGELWVSGDYGETATKIFDSAYAWSYISGPDENGWIYLGDQNSATKRTGRVKPVTFKAKKAIHIGSARTNICADPFGFSTGWTAQANAVVTDAAEAYYGTKYLLIDRDSASYYTSAVGSIAQNTTYRFVLAVKRHSPLDTVDSHYFNARVFWRQADGTTPVGDYADNNFYNVWVLSDRWKIIWFDATSPDDANVSRVLVAPLMDYGSDDAGFTVNTSAIGFLGIYANPGDTPWPGDDVAAETNTYTLSLDAVPATATIIGAVQKRSTSGWSSANTYTIFELADAASSPTNFYKLQIISGQVVLTDQTGVIATTTTGLPTQAAFETNDTLYWAVQWEVTDTNQVHLYIATQRSAVEKISADHDITADQKYLWIGSDRAGANQIDAHVVGWHLSPVEMTQAEIEAYWDAPGAFLPGDKLTFAGNFAASNLTVKADGYDGLSREYDGGRTTWAYVLAGGYGYQNMHHFIATGHTDSGFTSWGLNGQFSYIISYGHDGIACFIVGPGSVLYNSVCHASGADALYTEGTIVVKNNILIGETGTAIDAWTSGSGTPTESNNVILGDAVGVTPDASDVLTDPQLSADYRITKQSPAYGAGFFITGLHDSAGATDGFGTLLQPQTGKYIFNQTPSAGAHQPKTMRDVDGLGSMFTKTWALASGGFPYTFPITF